MKLTTTIEATLDLKKIIATTNQTINRHITMFVGEGNPALPQILTAARAARELIRGDANMTKRLIKMRPERKADYEEAWATAAEKQLMNAYGLINDAMGDRPCRLDTDGPDAMVASELDGWADAPTDAPKQNDHPAAPLIED